MKIMMASAKCGIRVKLCEKRCGLSPVGIMLVSLLDLTVHLFVVTGGVMSVSGRVVIVVLVGRW